MDGAAFSGQLAVLHWLRANISEPEWEELPHMTDLCMQAAGSGKIVVVQWLRANGCPWGTETTYTAAGEGHLEVLQWARANGCPWTRADQLEAWVGDGAPQAGGPRVFLTLLIIFLPPPIHF
jgi:hypothetical protein